MSDVQAKPSCETCMWWHRVGNSGEGHCGQNAAVVVNHSGEMSDGAPRKVGYTPFVNRLLTLSYELCRDWEAQPVRQRSGRDMLLEAVQPLVERLRHCEAKGDDLQDFMSVEVTVGWLRRVRDAVENEGQR